MFIHQCLCHIHHFISTTDIHHWVKRILSQKYFPPERKNSLPVKEKCQTIIKVHSEWTYRQPRRMYDRVSVWYVWKNITLFLLLCPSRTRLLCLTWAKGPGNNTLTPALSDSSWPRGSQLRLQVRSDHLRLLSQPPHSSPAFASSLSFSRNAPWGSLIHLTTLHIHTRPAFCESGLNACAKTCTNMGAEIHWSRMRSHKKRHTHV